MVKQLGHNSPLGAFHNLGSRVQRRSLGASSLSILNLKTFYPQGFPASAAAGEAQPGTADSTVARKEDTSASPPQAPTPSETTIEQVNPFRTSLQRYFAPEVGDVNEISATAEDKALQRSTDETTSEQAPIADIAQSVPRLQPPTSIAEISKNNTHSDLQRSAENLPSNEKSDSGQKPPIGLTSTDINQSIQSLREPSSPIQRQHANRQQPSKVESPSELEVQTSVSPNLPLNGEVEPTLGSRAAASSIQRQVSPAPETSANTDNVLSVNSQADQAQPETKDLGLNHGNELFDLTATPKNSSSPPTAVQRSIAELYNNEAIAGQGQIPVDLAASASNQNVSQAKTPLNASSPIQSTSDQVESIQRASQLSDSVSSELSLTNTTQLSANVLSETEIPENVSNVHSVTNSAESVQRANDLPQSTTASDDSGQVDITQLSVNSGSDAEIPENVRNVHSNANAVESVQRASDVTQSTTASHDSGQVDIVEPDDRRQIDTAQLSANVLAETEKSQSVSDVHSGANSTQSVQRAGDVTQSTTASHDSGQVDIVQPADRRQIETTQLSTNVLAETESTENLSDVQPVVNLAESVQRVSDVTQLATASNELGQVDIVQPGDLRQTDIAQLSANVLAETEKSQSVSDVHSGANSTQSVQRAGDVTQSTTASHDSGQVDIAQSGDLRQIDITQPSANVLAETESTENLSDVHFGTNSTESVQRAGDVTQSTTASNDSGQVDIAQSGDLRQIDITQPSANVLAETESTENLSDVHFGTNSTQSVQRTGDITQSTTVSHELGQVDIVQPDDLSQTDITQLSANVLAETESTENVNNFQPGVNFAESVQRAGDITQSTTASHDSGQVNIVQPDDLSQIDITQPSANVLAETESTENVNNFQPGVNFAESVQRAGDITQSTTASHDSDQLDIAQSADLSQIDITQPSANSRSDAESTENLRNVHSGANSVESVQRAGDVTQSTTASHDSGQVDIVSTLMTFVKQTRLSYRLMFFLKLRRVRI